MFRAETAQQWLDGWDSNQPVWSVEMGGIGPGYEQAIQNAAAEMLRDLLAHKPDVDGMSDDDRRTFRDAMDDRLFAEGGPLKGAGLTGAQHGAALNLAMCIYKRGPQSLEDAEVKDRRILVRKRFP